MANPIYNISTPQQGTIITSTAVATTARGDAAAVIYEEVTDLGGNKPRLQVAVSASTPIIASH